MSFKYNISSGLSYINFAFDDISVYNQIMELFNYIREAKCDIIQICNFDNDLNIIDFYTEKQLSNFWWPTAKESKQFWDMYINLPKEERNEYLEKQSEILGWDFSTVFREIGYGEYEIIECKIINNSVGRLTFYPYAFPYGGITPLTQAIKAFGVRILNEMP